MDEPILTTEPDSWHLYQEMLFCRSFEEQVEKLWHAGAITGEMHMSMGEEGIIAGIVDQLVDGDAMALDHRGTAPMLVRGVDPVALLKEFMGDEGGLCGGMGGHMHLFSPDHLAASSGIVGSSGPAAVGFALANKRLRPGKISVAFFGEGAVNEGMMMEAFNLAAAWKLPVMFVCKDNGKAVVTRGREVTGGSLIERANGFGLRAVEVDGSDVEAVWKIAKEEIARLRQGGGPVFLLAACVHLRGHFLGDQMLRLAHPSIGETIMTTIPLIKASLHIKGAALRERLAVIQELQDTASESIDESRSIERDPVLIMREKLSSKDIEKLLILEEKIKNEIRVILLNASIEGIQAGGQPA